MYISGMGAKLVGTVKYTHTKVNRLWITVHGRGVLCVCVCDKMITFWTSGSQSSSVTDLTLLMCTPRLLQWGEKRFSYSWRRRVCILARIGVLVTSW